ncbi:hypothetical protein ABZX92_23980, partial [Lentzea sp. NPDC006480]
MELRKLCEADAAELLQIIRESLTHLRPWMPWSHVDYDASAAASFLAMAAEGWERGTMFHHAITVDGAIVGPRPPRGLTTMRRQPKFIAPTRLSRARSAICGQLPRHPRARP